MSLDPSLHNPGVGIASAGTYAQHDSYFLMAHVEVFDGHTLQEITSTDIGGTSDIPSDLQWEGATYDSLSASTKASMELYEHKAVDSAVTTDLQKIGLTNQGTK